MAELEREIDDLDLVSPILATDTFPLSRDGSAKRGSALAVASYVIALLTSGSPTALDTWLEIVARLEDDEDALASLLVQMAGKASLTGAETLTNKTLTGPLINGAPHGEFLRGYISGLTVSNNASDATNDLDFTAGVAASDGTTPTLMTLAASMTKRLDANWVAGSGNGGLDTGSPANGWYYPYLIGKSTDPAAADILFSASPTSPTMPSGWDLKRMILPFWRDAGAIRPFIHRGGQDVVWVTPVEAFSSTSVSTSGALVTVAAPPVNGAKAIVRAVLSHGSGAVAWLRETTQVNDAPALANSDASTLSGGGRSHIVKLLAVNSSSQIRYRTDTATVGGFIIACEGFVFPR